MTEGLLGGILGGEDENSEVEATETLASADAFAAAVVARLSASDPEVARDTSAFLQEQTQLLKVQKDHLKDEHALRLNRLSGQAREGKLRRVGIRIRIGFQVFLALVATVIGIIAAVAIRDAVTSKRVVIEPFDAPPALATRGLSGKVIAGGLLDRTQPPAGCHPQQLLLRATFPAPGRATSSSRCRRPAFPSARSRACSESGSGMTCTSTGTSSRPRRGVSRSRSAATVCRQELQRLGHGAREAHGRGRRVRLLEIPAGAVGRISDQLRSQRRGNCLLPNGDPERGCTDSRRASKRLGERAREYRRFGTRSARALPRSRETRPGSLAVIRQHHEHVHAPR